MKRLIVFLLFSFDIIVEASFKLFEGAAVTDDSILLPEAANVIYCISNEKYVQFSSSHKLGTNKEIRVLVWNGTTDHQHQHHSSNTFC